MKRRNLLFLILLITVLYWAWYALPLKNWSLAVTEFAKAQGTFGMVIFSLIYIVATVALFPCAFLTFAAGMAYGFAGFPLVAISACIGACLAFLVSRHLVKDQVDRYMNKRLTTKALKMAIESEGWKFMILLRISPVIPFNVNNYFLGTVQVRFWTYLWVTAIGTLPGTALFIYLGVLGQDIGERQELRWAILIVGFVATAVLMRITFKRTQLILDRMSHGASLPS